MKKISLFGTSYAQLLLLDTFELFKSKVADLFKKINLKKLKQNLWLTDKIMCKKITKYDIALSWHNHVRTKMVFSQFAYDINPEIKDDKVMDVPARRKAHIVDDVWNYLLQSNLDFLQNNYSHDLFYLVETIDSFYEDFCKCLMDKRE